MKNIFRSVVPAALIIALASTAALAVPTTPTAAPDYKEGQSLYYNNAVTANPKCKFDLGDFTDALQKVVKDSKTSVTPIVVFEQRGTTTANDALTAFRGQALPDSNVTVFVACSPTGVTAAGYGGKLFQQYVTAEQWSGILKLASPKLKVAADQFALQVVTAAVQQINSGALAKAQQEHEADAAAAKKAADEAALKVQQEALSKKAAEELQALEDERNGVTHWVIYTLLVLLIGGGVVYFLRKKAQVK